MSAPAEARVLLEPGGDVDKVVAAAREQLPTVDPAEPLKQLEGAKSVSDKVDGLYKLGVAAAGKPDAKVASAFERALSDEDATVRHAAIVAAGYLGWQELRALLKKLAAEDEDESVRKDAALMLESLEQHA